MNIYSATPPAASNPDDVRATALANLPSSPDIFQMMGDGTCQVIYNTLTLTAQQITTYQTAVAATTPNPNSPWNIQTSLLNKAQNAISSNVTFLALGSPTNAQVLAQVQALTKQVDAIIQVFINGSSSTQGT